LLPVEASAITRASVTSPGLVAVAAVNMLAIAIKETHFVMLEILSLLIGDLPIEDSVVNVQIEDVIGWRRQRIAG
jgi:hypothetical protein